MMVGEELPMRPLAARERRRRRPVLRQATEGTKTISTTKGAKATKQTGHDDT
jgi:hypothetical protein